MRGKYTKKTSQPPMYGQQSTNEGWNGRKSLMSEMNKDSQMSTSDGSTATGRKAIVYTKRNRHHG